MKVAVLPNLDKRGSAEVVEKLGVILKNEGIEGYLPDNIAGADFKHLPEEQLYKIADFIITIGGDGTIIRYAKRAAFDNKPVLGINAGRMGYLANIEQNELGLISKLKTGEYFVENRMMLSVSVVENGKKLAEYNALNDAVITSGFISRIIDISVAVGRDYINYRADGLILSTPTGSTAYNLSAGGPLVHPKAKVFVMTPICPHTLSNRSLVYDASAKIKISCISGDCVFVSDGRIVANFPRCAQADIFISSKTVKFSRLHGHSHFSILRSKLGWAEDPRHSKI